MRWLWLVLFGCRAHTPSTNAVEASVLYQAELVGVFGPIEDQTSGDVLQEELEVKMELRLRIEPTRGFRDGSYGRNIYIESASIQERTGESHVAFESELVGRSVELRTFPDGEILDVAWADKVAGPSRYLDVFEIMYPAVSPAAPTISEGDLVKQRIIWPFRLENIMRWDNIVDAVWRNNGKKEIDGIEVWSISYEGPWGTEGKTRRMVPSQIWMANGAAKGSVYFERKTSDLVSHTFEWSRVVSVKGKSGDVSQAQTFTGSVGRIR